MERLVYFRDYQEQQAADHTALQANARASLDHLVTDVVTTSRRFAGLSVVKSAQAEITIAAGRFYDVGGGIYNKSSATVQSLLSYLPAAAKRIITVVAGGQENDIDVAERDFLVNVDTGQTEPRPVAITRSRDLLLSVIAGAESVDPQPPAIPVGYVAVADALLDTTQVVSIAMRAENEVTSTDDLDIRTDDLEAFKAATEPRLRALASDLASLQNQLNKQSLQQIAISLYADVATLKDLSGLPDDYTDYGADTFGTKDKSDTGNTQALGYDAEVLMGLRFPDANAGEAEIALFSAFDPNASLDASGLLLPKFVNDLKIKTGDFGTDVGLSQYGSQTFNLVQKKLKTEVVRYGQRLVVTGTTNLYYTHPPFGEHSEIPVFSAGSVPNYQIEDYCWTESFDVPYTDIEVINHAIAGAQMGQSVLVSNDMWLTQIGFGVAAKAANEPMYVTVCEVVNGVPDMTAVIAHVTVPHTALAVGEWCRVAIPPTFLLKGQRIAVLLTSAANHKLYLTGGKGYAEGTSYYSTDGSYYLGDLTKDIALELWGAKFSSPQVVLEMAPLNLDGGIRSIDITARRIVPDSAAIFYEVRAPGGQWVPLTVDDPTILNTAPPLLQFRVRFVGTSDMHAGVVLAGSRVKVSRPKTALTHISTPITLAAASQHITITLIADAFDETPHDLGCRLRVGAAWETADATVTKTLNAARKRIERKFQFDLAAPTSTFTVEIQAMTNSPNAMFAIGRRVHHTA